MVGLASAVPHLSTSFFIDCSPAASTPDGMATKTYCPPMPHSIMGKLMSALKSSVGGATKVCRPLNEECSRVRRVLDQNKATLLRPSPGPLFCIGGETVFVHYANGNHWEKCCFRGDEGKVSISGRAEESARCQSMTEVHREPPPLQMPPREDKNPLRAAQSVKRRLEFFQGLSAAKGKQTVAEGLDQVSCMEGGRSGEYPPAIILKDPWAETVCLKPGLSGELYAGDYKVVFLSLPAEDPAVAALSAPSLAVAWHSDRSSAAARQRRSSFL